MTKCYKSQICSVFLKQKIVKDLSKIKDLTGDFTIEATLNVLQYDTLKGY